MRVNVFMSALLSVVLAMTMALPYKSFADSDQAQVQTGQDIKLKEEELAQLLAPVALYPDPLLAQILMASTYPLEVVESARWVKENPNLKGDDLDNAIKDKDWDVSIKSITHFPEVLQMMNDKVEWTEKLGDAFLAQKDSVMNMIQELRAKSKDTGNLKTTKEQNVIVEDKIIRIEPADPEVVYVPMYDPLAVYGPWWYPAFPPYPVYYPGWIPGPRAVAGISFASGFFVGAAVTSWAGFGWGRNEINVNVNKTKVFNNATINKNVNIQKNKQVWQHDVTHRKGVPYKNQPAYQRGRSYERQVPTRHTSFEEPRVSRQPSMNWGARSGGVNRAMHGRRR